MIAVDVLHGAAVRGAKATVGRCDDCGSTSVVLHLRVEDSPYVLVLSFNEQAALELQRFLNEGLAFPLPVEHQASVPVEIPREWVS